MSNNNQATLKFENGKFILEIEPRHILYPKIDQDYWARPCPYTTSSLRAAAEFRHLSDEKTKLLFDNVFNCTYDIPTLPRLSYLDAHQQEGVKFILSRKRSYLAHAPGAGKTAQAIVASDLSGCSRSLFIVPPSLTKNWERELEKFSGGFYSVSIVPSTAKQNQMNWYADFIICPDSMITKSWVYTKLLERKFKFIAIDEASRFKEPTAQRTLALFGEGNKYAGLTRNARHVVLLDGSPMPNRPMELWAPVYALDPEAIECMDRHEFGLKFCGARVNDRGCWEYRYSSNESELREALQTRFMHVVSEAQLHHPERRRSITYLPMVARALPKPKLPIHVNESHSKGSLAKTRRELGVAKIPFIVQYVIERLQSGESILVFAWHREVCIGIKEGLKKFQPELVMGGTKSNERESAFTAFNSGASHILIGNIQAMGRGHNLQKADRVIFGEYSWTDESNLQCEKRASRRGSTKAFVRCEYLVVPDSLDEVVLKSVMSKQKRVKQVIG